MEKYKTEERSETDLKKHQALIKCKIMKAIKSD